MAKSDIYAKIKQANNDLKLMELAKTITDKEWYELRQSLSSIPQIVREKPLEFLKLTFWAGQGELAQRAFTHSSKTSGIFQLPLDIVEATWKRVEPEGITSDLLKTTIVFMGWDRPQHSSSVENSSRPFPQEVALLRLINQKVGDPKTREKSPFDPLLQEAFNGLINNALSQVQYKGGKQVAKALVKPSDFCQGGQSAWASHRSTKLAEAFYNSRSKDFSLFMKLGEVFEDFAQVPQDLTHKRYMQLVRNGLKEGYTHYSLNNIVALHDLKEDIFKQSDYKKVIVHYANNRWDDSTTPAHLEKMWDKLELDQQKAFAKSLVQQAPYVLETLVDFIDEKIVVGAWADFFQSRLDKTPKCQRLWQKHIILDEVQEKIDAKTVQKRKM